jgi:hypothetical protein
MTHLATLTGWFARQRPTDLGRAQGLTRVAVPQVLAEIDVTLTKAYPKPLSELLD